MRIENLKMRIEKLSFFALARFFALPCLLAFLCLYGLTACDHKDLCYHHDHIVTLELRYDWRDAPEANPAGMCAYFYPEDGGSPYVFQFDNIVGGEISLPEGRYKALTYNNDTPSISFGSEHDITLHYAFTREGTLFEPLGMYSVSSKAIPSAPGAENERVLICPDELWGCHAIEISITEQGISYICLPLDPDNLPEDKDLETTYTHQLITLYPHELTCVYTYEIRNVTNLDQISRMSASLSGLSPKLQLFDEELDRECITHPFEATARPSENKITGRFITFGHHEENEEPHRMMLYVWTLDGNQYAYGSKSDKFDLTDQVHSAPNKRRVHLIIDGLDIPEPVKSETGTVEPDVDDWGEIFFDIQM